MTKQVLPALPGDAKRNWSGEIEKAEESAAAGDIPAALTHGRRAAALARRLSEPDALRRTARVFTLLSNFDVAEKLLSQADQIAHAEFEPGNGPLGPMELFAYLDVDAASAARTTFKYLRNDDGPHRLRAVKNKALIACTSRSGSTLLAASLERYGLDAQEFFNPEGPVKQAVYAGVARSIRDYANQLAQTAVKGGWFVTKGALDSFFSLCYLREFPERSVDWKIILLRRRNVIRQAVSMEVAAKTQQWNSRQPKLDVVRPTDYSFDSLEKRLEYILAANEKWERAVTVLGIEPYRLFFEDLIGDVTGETENVARYLGIDVGSFPQASGHAPWPQSQSTPLNAQWETRFRRDLSKRISVRTQTK
jgi:LPS sulfotransferase NodH